MNAKFKFEKVILKSHPSCYIVVVCLFVVFVVVTIFKFELISHYSGLHLNSTTTTTWHTKPELSF